MSPDIPILCMHTDYKLLDDGMKANKFPLYIKEMEWCFNNRNKNRSNILVSYLLEKLHI